MIYDTAFSLRLPGSKECLLQQQVPATYLALEDIVSHIATQMKVSGIDPVLKFDAYRDMVNSEMLCRNLKCFRDNTELSQATMFLHENGVLLHYDDATLDDLYFLDPQWLCDFLSSIITVREINPFATNGIMKMDDLQHLFKNLSISSNENQR